MVKNVHWLVIYDILSNQETGLRVLRTALVYTKEDRKWRGYSTTSFNFWSILHLYTITIECLCWSGWNPKTGVSLWGHDCFHRPNRDFIYFIPVSLLLPTIHSPIGYSWTITFLVSIGMLVARRKPLKPFVRISSKNSASGDLSDSQTRKSIAHCTIDSK